MADSVSAALLPLKSLRSNHSFSSITVLGTNVSILNKRRRKANSSNVHVLGPHMLHNARIRCVVQPCDWIPRGNLFMFLGQMFPRNMIIILQSEQL